MTTLTYADAMGEVAVRHNETSPDAGLLAAAYAATTRLRAFLGGHSYYA
jgi:hypothetical protein